MRELITYLFLCLFLILCSCNENVKQEKSSIKNIDTIMSREKNIQKKESFKPMVNNSPNELLEFVPKNYSILDTVSGDLNLDDIKDYILILKKNGEDSLSDFIENPEKRPLLILLRNKDNKLQLARKNNNTVYCVDCGGMMGDPFMGVTIKNGYFSIEHYGGSSWRWTRIITYKYNKQENEWFLHKDGSVSFHASDPETEETKIKTTKDFGRVKFENFDIYKEE